MYLKHSPSQWMSDHFKSKDIIEINSLNIDMFLNTFICKMYELLTHLSVSHSNVLVIHTFYKRILCIF